VLILYLLPVHVQEQIYWKFLHPYSFTMFKERTPSTDTFRSNDKIVNFVRIRANFVLDSLSKSIKFHALFTDTIFYLFYFSILRI